jgi:formylglycine-generating enzyme required for sulfatase activity
MKDSEGNRVNREVIEAYGSGFSQDEYRLMIQWFNELSAEHFDVQPLLVFGNLPEHQKYTIDNQTFNFWYTGLGTRSYGTLRKTNTVRGLHMETPNSMRFNIEAREKTILTMAAFFERVHAELMYPQKVLDKPLERKRVEVATVELPAAVFNYRKKMVSVLPLKASTTEVTIDEFASYLNELLKQNKAQIDMEHRRVNGTNGELICFLDAYSEDDMLLVEEGLISAAANRGNYPMTNLTWHAAVDYAEFRGGRLPTETEWVRLAGYWDDELHTYATEHDDYEHLEQNINFEGSLDAKTGCTYPQDLPVATLPANGNGLYDMSGNVWEWCSDWFHSQYYRNLEAEMTHADPRGPESGTMRTTKGGSWGAGVEVTKTSYRVALAPELTLADLGFRIVWDL